MEQINEQINKYYQRLLATHGDSPQSVDYLGRQSQYKRFEILAAIAPLGGKQLLDVGCGLGHLYDFLLEHGIKPKDYKGIDITPEMIGRARMRHPELDFNQEDLLTQPDPVDPPYDYVISSGIFHYRADYSDEAWSEFCRTMIEKMFKYARYGLAFNMLSDLSPERQPQQFYAEPGYYFNYCRKNLSQRVCLRHDYPLPEFTIFVFRAE